MSGITQTDGGWLPKMRTPSALIWGAILHLGSLLVPFERIDAGRRHKAPNALPRRQEDRRATLSGRFRLE